jgi:site-specific recombinase
VTGLYEAKLPPRIVLTSAEEALADSALLILSRLRDQLVQRDANRTAWRVDETMEALVDACRGRDLVEARRG